MKVYATRDEMVRDLLPPGSAIAEIGVFKGEFAEVLWSTRPRKLLLVDPFEGHTVSGDADGNNVVPADLDYEYMRLQRRWAPHPEVQLIRGRSPTALLDLSPRCLDAVYIDGDHSYAGCYADLLLAHKLVRPGGWILGHDWATNTLKTKNVYNFGVREATEEFCCRTGLTLSALAADGQMSYGILVQSSAGTK